MYWLQDKYTIYVQTQYTYIIVKYKINLYSLRNRPEKLAEGSLICLFLKLVQIYFIFTDNVRIPFINVVKGVFFVVRVTLVPVSYLSAPSAVHSYRVPGKFIRLVRIKQKFIRIAYSYIVVKYKIHLYWLRNRHEKLAEGSLFCLFLKLVQINFIFTDNVRILYIYHW
jgi:hypothetical protein